MNDNDTSHFTRPEANQPGGSPYARGARDGWGFGLFLSLMFLASVYSSSYPLLTIVALVMMLAVPFIIYSFLRRAYITDKGTTILSSLWMHGIMIFLCGSLISGVVEVVWFKWINPSYVADQINRAIELYGNSNWERGEQLADMLQTMIDNNMVPDTMSIVTEMIWLGVFTGSILSVLMALLVRARKVTI